MQYFRQPIRPDTDTERPPFEEPDPRSAFGADRPGRLGRFRTRIRVRSPGVVRPHLKKRTLAVLSGTCLLITGSVTAYALSGEPETVAAGRTPAPATVTTFPPFPSASVMPPPDTTEQPDGGVIEAPELPAGAQTPPQEGPTPSPDTSAATPPLTTGEQRSTSAADGATALPVHGYVITAPYDQAGNWSTGHHTGVDLAVPVGTPVMSVRAGVVIMSTTDAKYGTYVLIRHAEHQYTLYAHLSRPEVEQGATVSAGQEIGLSGATGNVTGPHLHFEVRTEPVFGSDIDPVAYLADHGVLL